MKTGLSLRRALKATKQSLLILALFIFPSWGQADQGGDGPFAVVELFSSEGCSSCPAADLLVSKLTVWSRQHKAPVYPLIFHVDYWNDQGWRDVFSNPAYTERQKVYAGIFKDQGVYTPEMIVNGSDAFVGSDQDQLQKDLDQELSISSDLNLHASMAKGDGQVTVKYSVDGFAKGDVINIALVERGLSTAVTAGENDGRTLHHDNVVKEFQTVPLKPGEAEAVVSLRKIIDLSQASVVLYVQNPQTMFIEDAKELDLNNG